MVVLSQALSLFIANESLLVIEINASRLPCQICSLHPVYQIPHTHSAPPQL